MKTTVEIPDALFRKAKAVAAEQGVSLKDFFTVAVREHLRRGARVSLTGAQTAPPWTGAFGGLRALHKETEKINRVIAEEFEQIEDEEWR